MKNKKRIGNEAILVNDGKIEYIEFECLNKHNHILTHFISTKTAIIENGDLKHLDLGFRKGDKKEKNLENFKIICDGTGVNTDSLVFANQVHGNTVKIVDESHKGKVFSPENDIIEADGFATMTPGVVLVTFHADCVPIMLFEPDVKAISVLHSGWRGTLKNIVSKGIEAMSTFPNFCVSKVVAVIGPSIGSCCFEVDEDVYNLFMEKYGNHEYYRYQGNGKWTIDLKKIIELQLNEAGLLYENTHNSNICTKCRNDLFFSYRGDRGDSGSMGAFMMIKQSSEETNNE